MKPCIKCGATERYKTGACKACQRAIGAKQLDSRHGFSPSIVAAMKLAQGGRCAICRVTLTEGNGASSMQRDHCHDCNSPRGLLCSSCNFSLGHYEKYQHRNGLILEAYDRYLAAHLQTHEHLTNNRTPWLNLPAGESPKEQPCKPAKGAQTTIFDRIKDETK